MLSIPVVIIGAVLAALIAGFFSFLNLVISKEQKVSEFRQNWIDALREEISQYVSAISFIASANHVANKNPSDSELREHWEMLKDAFNHAAKSHSSIVLRLNPTDSDETLRTKNIQFLEKLNEVRDLVRSSKYYDAKVEADALTPLAQPILKHEWERVKAGEKIFRYTRNLAGAIVLLAVTLGIALFSFKADSKMTVETDIVYATSKQSNESCIVFAQAKTEQPKNRAIQKKAIQNRATGSRRTIESEDVNPYEIEKMYELNRSNSSIQKHINKDEQPASEGGDRLPKP